MYKKVELIQSTDEDKELVYNVLKAASKAYVIKTWGRWNEGIQRTNFDENFDCTNVRIIHMEGKKIGFISTIASMEEIFLGELNILPEFQGCGVGTLLIENLIEEASTKNIPIKLHVLKANPACLLYERLGFEVTGGTRSHYHMEWRREW